LALRGTSVRILRAWLNESFIFRPVQPTGFDGRPEAP